MYQSLYGILNLFISQCINGWVQERCDYCVKHSKELVHPRDARWPQIGEDAGYKEQHHHCDVEVQVESAFDAPSLERRQTVTRM